MSLEDLIGAKKDFLTGCSTKESLVPLFIKLGGEYKLAKRLFSILLIDLDRFKSFNDKYGHVYGDEALKYFSSSMRLSMGGMGFFTIRYGGDEFIIVFPGKGSAEAYHLSKQLEVNIKARPLLLKGRLFKMSFSGGVAAYPEDGETIEDLINNADKAMYFSKRHGHGNITRFSKIRQFKIRQLIISILILAVTVFLIVKYYTDYYSPDLLEKVKSRITERVSSGKSGIAQKVRPFFKPKRRLGPESRIRLAPDKVYLKSGGVIEGIIAREDAESLEIKLDLERGEGTMTFQKSDVVRIERKEKKSK